MDGGIKFDVSANTAKFDADMARVGNSATTVGRKIKAAFAGVGGLLAGGMVLGGLKSVMGEFDRIGKLATRFGTSAESIQRVGVAAQVAGTDVEAVANAMTKAGIAASNAVAKGGEMAELFERAGISAKSFAAAQLDEKLLMVATAFRAAGNDASKTNAIIEIMGSRSGANLIPLISDLDALQKEMAGVSVASEDTVRQIEAANDTLTRFGNDAKVVAAQSIGFLGRQFQRLGSAIAAIQTGDASVFGKTVAELEAMSGAADQAAGGMDGFADSADSAAAVLADLNKQMAGWESDFSRRFKEPAEQVAILQQRINALVREYQYDPQKETLQEIKKLTEERLRLEDKITKETAKQADQLAKEQEARLKSRTSLEEEAQLMRARRLGDVSQEEAILQRRDMREALERTGGDMERAAAFVSESAATRAAERSTTSRPQTALEALQEQNDVNSRVAAARIAASSGRLTDRAAQLLDSGNFRSAARVQARAERRAENAAVREFSKQSIDAQFGTRNFGDAYQEYLKAEGGKLSAKFKTQSEFEKAMREQAKTSEEFKEAEERRKAAMGGSGRAAAVADKPATEATLKQILEKVQERPILVA